MTERLWSPLPTIMGGFAHNSPYISLKNALIRPSFVRKVFSSSDRGGRRPPRAPLPAPAQYPRQRPARRLLPLGPPRLLPSVRIANLNALNLCWPRSLRPVDRTHAEDNPADRIRSRRCSSDERTGPGCRECVAGRHHAMGEYGVQLRCPLHLSLNHDACLFHRIGTLTPVWEPEAMLNFEQHSVNGPVEQITEGLLI